LIQHLANVAYCCLVCMWFVITVLDDLAAVYCHGCQQLPNLIWHMSQFPIFGDANVTT